MENLVSVLQAHNTPASFFLTNVYIKKFTDAPRLLNRAAIRSTTTPARIRTVPK
jgi:hypothetical protein